MTVTSAVTKARREAFIHVSVLPLFTFFLPSLLTYSVHQLAAGEIINKPPEGSGGLLLFPFYIFITTRKSLVCAIVLPSFIKGCYFLICNWLPYESDDEFGTEFELKHTSWEVEKFTLELARCMVGLESFTGK